MTGQVKEEVLCRFAELGVRIAEGIVRFQPRLLRKQEFVTEPRELCFLDVNGDWQTLAVPAAGLAFTWCQVPVVYDLDDDAEPSLTITYDDDSQETISELALPAAASVELFKRSGRVRRIDARLRTDLLLPG